MWYLLARATLSESSILANGRCLLQNVTRIDRVEREVLVALDKLALDGVLKDLNSCQP